jgi:hypothetical protein
MGSVPDLIRRIRGLSGFSTVDAVAICHIARGPRVSAWTNFRQSPGTLGMATHAIATMVSSARYQILVQGYLDASWSGRLGGLAIGTTVQEDGAVVTSLTGELMDQSALLGVLNTLSSLHLAILSVCYLSEDK